VAPAAFLIAIVAVEVFGELKVQVALPSASFAVEPSTVAVEPR
jgi:hypothetical protein